MNEITDRAAELAGEWLTEKARLATQQAVVDAIGEQLVAILGAKPEGSQTHKTGHFAIEITGRQSYACPDLERLATLAPTLVRPSLHDSAVKKLRAADPTFYAALAAADLITVKPGKTGVTVKLLEVA